MNQKENNNNKLQLRNSDKNKERAFWYNTSKKSKMNRKI